MARDGSNIYSAPAGTLAVSGTTIESAKYNAFVNDLVADANLPRPIVAGGTGASTAGGWLAAMGVTATAAEINTLDGITATVAELNVLDGIPGTLTATEIGYLDGVTSAIQTQLNAKQATITTLPLANGGTGVALVDPGADRLMFWDDSAGATAYLTVGTGLSITGTTLDATGGRTLLATKTASASASLIFTEVNAALFRDYLFKLRGVMPGTTARALQLEVSANGGSSWSPANYQTYISGSEAGAAGVVDVDTVIGALWSVTPADVSNAVNAHGVFGELTIYDAGVAKRTRFIEALNYDNANSVFCRGSGTTNDAAVHNAFRWTFSGGATVLSGAIEMWGLV